MKFINRRETKPIVEAVERIYGADVSYWLDEFFFCIGSKDRLSLVSRSIDGIPLEKLRVSSIGLYVGEWKNDVLRLSIEGSQLVFPKAKKNILEIVELKQWLRGEDIETSAQEGFYIITHKGDALGCGKVKEGKLLNFVPKARRISSSDVPF
jgi:NOL1/NOP2/fmu family ribosome biogenesis protein